MCSHSLDDTTDSDSINISRLLSLLLVLSWPFVPIILWLACALLVSVMIVTSRFRSLVILLASFSVAMLIASRYVGFLWGGADDMPSYFMAYERYDDFASMMPMSLLYAKHADFLFALFGWSIAKVSDNHLFVYYFTTVFSTYLLIWWFCKTITPIHAVLCFFLIILFYKFFQAQWHLIRACLALSLLIGGLYIAGQSRSKGTLVYFIGGLIHFSTFILAFPLFLIRKHLAQRWSGLQIFGLVAGFLIAVSFGLIAVKILAGFVNNYMVNKIVTRLIIEPNFSKLPSLLFFYGVLLFSIPTYINGNNKTQQFLFNSALYFIVIGTVALFFIGEELHRVILPLYLIYAPLFILSSDYYLPNSTSAVASIGLQSFVVLAFCYVLFINESNFFYRQQANPIELNGKEFVEQFVDYLQHDLSYYDGYRNK